MTLRVGESFLALVLAVAFSILGRYIIGRPASGIRQWNECFLTGLSASALMLFPFSLISPHHGLLACGLVLGAALSVFVVRNRSEVRPLWRKAVSIRAHSIDRHPRLDIFERVALGGMIWAILQFVVQDFRLSFLWDGYQIWASKAMLLFYKGGLSRDWFLPGAYERVLEYPPMVSLWEALIALMRGEFEWNSVKVIFPFFFVSTLVSVYFLSCAIMPRRLAFASSAIVSLIPGFSTYFSVGGYADMPQACLITGAVAAVVNSTQPVNGFRNPAVWIMAGVCMVKAEGTLLMMILALCIVCYWGVARLWAKLLEQRQSIAILISPLVIRFFYVRWLGETDTTYGPIDKAHLIHAWHLLWAIPVACFPYLVTYFEWGYLWPAFVICSLVTFLIGSRLQKCLAFGTVSALIAYTSIFYFTNWEFKWHIQLAYPRLLTQLTPLCTIVVMGAQAEVYRRWNAANISSGVPPSQLHLSNRDPLQEEVHAPAPDKVFN